MAFTSEPPAGSSRVSSTRLPSKGGTVGPTVGSQLLAQIGTELSEVLRKLLERVRSNEFVDFMELPPARRKCKTLSKNLGDQIGMVQVRSRVDPASPDNPGLGYFAAVLCALLIDGAEGTT